MKAQYQTETVVDPGQSSQDPECALVPPGLPGPSEGADTFTGLRSVCLDAETRIARLTRREREVCDLVTRGLTSKQIALALKCSPRTVEIHRAHLMLKLAADSTADLVRLAIYAGLTDLVKRVNAAQCTIGPAEECYR